MITPPPGLDPDPTRLTHVGGFLVLGYGNELLSDDAIGPRIARCVVQLDLPNVRALDVAQLTPELAEPISRADGVFFVDATVRIPAGRVAVVRLRPDDLGVSDRACRRWAPTGTGGSPFDFDSREDSVNQGFPGDSLGHGWSPPVLLMLARTVFGREPPAWMVAIGAECFDLGQSLSSRVEEAIPTAMCALRTLIRRRRRGDGGFGPHDLGRNDDFEADGTRAKPPNLQGRR